VVFTESQPMFDKKVQYRVIDAAVGTVGKGGYHNDDAAAREQPWLPNGGIPHLITWTREGYTPRGVPYPGPGEFVPLREPAPATDALPVGGT
jgi:hypothetical protein